MGTGPGVRERPPRRGGAGRKGRERRGAGSDGEIREDMLSVTAGLGRIFVTLDVRFLGIWSGLGLWTKCGDGGPASYIRFFGTFTVI